MKQQLDYPRAVGYDELEKMSSRLQQLIGFFSRTPSTLDEWYQKPENRFYRPGQD
jgi:ectoine hydroxylase-related dioxygenase (phytanoyl-CoA dioxygenase family)